MGSFRNYIALYAASRRIAIELKHSPVMLESLTHWPARIFAVTWLSYAGFTFAGKTLASLLTHDLGYSNADLANVIFAHRAAYAAG